MRTIDRFLAGVAAAAAGVAAGPDSVTAQSVPPPPPAAREFRAAWTATVSNIDWPTGTGQSQSTQKAALTGLMDVLVSLNMNAMYLQVRPECDALYQSSLEPWSRFLQGTEGVSPGYDPLTFAVDEAHKRGLELHVWVNPYRASTTTTSSTKAASSVVRTSGSLVRRFGTTLWLDPGEPRAEAHTESVILDIVRRYDIDGVVFDDYFYPYPISGTPFPDATTYALYNPNGLGLADWRRENVNRLIRDLNTGIHAIKPWVRFGIGPFGIWRPGNPPGIVGLDSYDAIYGDSRRWLREGWVDTLSPQLYWTIASTGQPYKPLQAWWADAAQNPLGRMVLVSNYTGKNGTTGWPTDEIVNQVKASQEQPGVSGNVHFSMKSLKNDTAGVATGLRAGPYAKQALPPACPWLDSTPPAAPLIHLKPGAGTAATVTWAQQGTEAAALWAVYVYRAGVWKLNVKPGTSGTFTVDTAMDEAVAVAAVDRVGNEGPRTMRGLRAGIAGWRAEGGGVD